MDNDNNSSTSFNILWDEIVNDYNNLRKTGAVLDGINRIMAKIILLIKDLCSKSNSLDKDNILVQLKKLEGILK